MPTLAQLRSSFAPLPASETNKTNQREVLVTDLRCRRRPTDFVEQKLRAALERPSCQGLAGCDPHDAEA